MELDEYQQAAVRTPEERVLVVAPPGSGKTTVMLQRLRHLLQGGMAPRRILVLTFSKASAVEMEERFSRDHSALSRPFFGTMHGLAYQTLRRLRGAPVLIYGAQEYRMRNLLKRRLRVGEEDVEMLLRGISSTKTRRFLLGAEAPTAVGREDLFQAAYTLYEEERKKRGLLDFDDLQIAFLELLREEGEKDALLGGVEGILVDEFQDLDPLQLEIIRLLSKDRALFCVGDEDQCIYAFRGSDPQGMMDFETRFHGVKLYLKYNYRSRRNIVDYAGTVIAKNRMRSTKELRAGRGEETKVVKVVPENQDLMLQDVARRIREGTHGSYAVLYRTNQEGMRVKEFLRREGISFRTRDGYNFFQGTVARDLLDYLRASVLDDREAFLRIVNKPYRYIPKGDIRKIQQGASVEEVLLHGDKAGFTLAKNRQFLKDLAHLRGMAPGKAVHHIKTVLGYLTHLTDYAAHTGREEEVLLEDLEEFAEIAHFHEGPLSLFEAATQQEEDPDAKVLLSTVHGVKGLEYDVVFVLNAVEGFMPHAAALSNLEEERRIFYVALTRAREALYIYAPRFIHGKERKKSRFLV